MIKNLQDAMTAARSTSSYPTLKVDSQTGDTAIQKLLGRRLVYVLTDQTPEDWDMLSNRSAGLETVLEVERDGRIRECELFGASMDVDAGGSANLR